jgi:hypothetical protein
VGLPIGDTISSANLFDVVEEYLGDHPRPRDSVRFDVGAASLLDWNAAVEWMADARRDGCNLVRYILYERPSGGLVIDLAAIESSDSTIDPPAV